MGIQILDTEIFIKNNFFHGKKISSMIRLGSKGLVNLYITEITYHELVSNFNKSADRARSNHKRFINEQENWILRNDAQWNNFFSKIDATALKNDFKNTLDIYIKDGIIKVIPYAKVDIKGIFEKYFKALAPFGSGDKKSEFPDAFSIELIKLYLTDNKLEGIIFSGDNDFVKCSSPELPVTSELDSFLDDKFKHLEKIRSKIIDTLFLENQDKIKGDFTEWFKDSLDDFSLYYNAVNLKDVYDVEIKEINISDLNYNIISVEEDMVSIEITAIASVEVHVLTDDESLVYYDSDDKSYHYPESVYEPVKTIFQSSTIVTSEIINEDEYYGFEVESINENLELTFGLSDGIHDY